MYPEMPMHMERELPSFYLRQEDLPEILKWQVNGKYYIVMKVEMTGTENKKDLGSKQDASKMEAEFQVLSVRALGDKPIDPTTIEKQDFDKLVTKIKSGVI